MKRWTPIVARAKTLVGAFTRRFERPPTLRKNHYDLVSDAAAVEAGYRNRRYDYKRLSELTAEGRRDGSFPDYQENVRTLTREDGFADADELREHVREIAKLDRMEGQEVAVCAAVEKDGLRGFLHDWFDPYSLLVTSLNGYSSQTLFDKLVRWQRRDGRRLIVLLATDHDPSGEDIVRDARARLGHVPIEVRHIGLLPEHIEHYGLPRSFDVKEDDSRLHGADPRNASFLARHGGLWQTELDALDPDDLQALFEQAFHDLWDMSVYQARLDGEQALRDDVLG